MICYDKKLGQLLTFQDDFFEFTKKKVKKCENN